MRCLSDVLSIVSSDNLVLFAYVSDDVEVLGDVTNILDDVFHGLDGVHRNNSLTDVHTIYTEPCLLYTG